MKIRCTLGLDLFHIELTIDSAEFTQEGANFQIRVEIFNSISISIIL